MTSLIPFQGFNEDGNMVFAEVEQDDDVAEDKNHQDPPVPLESSARVLSEAPEPTMGSPNAVLPPILCAPPSPTAARAQPQRAALRRSPRLAVQRFSHPAVQASIQEAVIRDYTRSQKRRHQRRRLRPGGRYPHRRRSNGVGPTHISVQGRRFKIDGGPTFRKRDVPRDAYHVLMSSNDSELLVYKPTQDYISRVDALLGVYPVGNGSLLYLVQQHAGDPTSQMMVHRQNCSAGLKRLAASVHPHRTPEGDKLLHWCESETWWKVKFLTDSTPTKVRVVWESNKAQWIPKEDLCPRLRWRVGKLVRLYQEQVSNKLQPTPI